MRNSHTNGESARGGIHGWIGQFCDGEYSGPNFDSCGVCHEPPIESNENFSSEKIHGS